MFVRILEGPVLSKPLLRNAWDHLNEALARHSSWLGSDAGIDRRHEFFASIRIASPAQAQELLGSEMIAFWWDELLRHLDSCTVTESADVEILIPGGEADTGFVQVLHGHTTDKKQMQTMNSAMQEIMITHRPDVLGSVLVWFEDDRFTEVVHFSSEQEARSAESTEFPGGVQALFGELMQVMDDLYYVDLPDPWVFAAGTDDLHGDLAHDDHRPANHLIEPPTRGGETG